MSRLIWFLALSLGGAPVSWAAERFEYYNGARQMGMGGAHVATANDETALFANPAALAKLREPILTIFDPEISGNDKLTTIGTGVPVGDLVDPQKLLDRMRTQPGTHVHARGQLSPGAVFPGFGFAVLARYSWDAEVDSTGTNYELNYFNDYALALGYAVKLLDGRIKIGVSGRYLNRIEVQRTLPAATTGLEMSTLVNEGNAIASDVGLILTAPWTWLPTLAATWRDVGNTTFNLGNGFVYKPTATDRRPQVIPQTLDAAFGLFPIHGKNIRSTFTAEYRDVLNAIKEEPVDSMKKVHVGLELNIGDTLFLRAGMNQRYWTGGLEFSMPYFQMQFASYGEEIGTATTNREDRRYMMKAAIRF